MFGRKNKKLPKQSEAGGRTTGRVVRQSGRGAVSPAFSYYASRPQSVTPREHRPKQRPQEQPRLEQNKQRRSLSYIFSFWLLMCLVVVCILKLLWLNTNPRVVVIGKNSISAAYVQPSSVYASAAHKLLASSITSHTKLTADLTGTARRLEQQFPELQHVVLNVPIASSRPVMYVEIAQPSLVLRTQYGSYVLNNAGVVLARLHSVPTHMPLVIDQATAPPQLGKQYLPSSTVTFVQTVAYQFAVKRLTISAFTLPVGAPYELDVRLSGKSYIIRFNLEQDPLVQSGAAIATIQQLAGRDPRLYLDVRVPGRVYYK